MKITKCEKANCPNNALYSRGTKRYGAVCLGAKCHIQGTDFEKVLKLAVNSAEYETTIKNMSKNDLEIMLTQETRKTGLSKIKKGLLNANKK